MRFSRILRAMILTVLAATVASADVVTLTLDFVSQSGPPNSLLTFNGVLSNSSGNDTFLNGADSNVGYSELVVDFTSFFSNAPLFLPDQASYSGPLFTVAISQSALPGQYFGSIDIQGGIDGNASDIIASNDFEVDVVNTPEPQSRLALVTMLATLVTGRSWKAARAKWN